MDQEHFRRKMQMQVVGYPFRHGRRAYVKTVRLGNIHHLLGGLSDARANKRIVLLQVRAGQLAVNKSKVAGDHIIGGDESASRLALGKMDSVHFFSF